MGERSGIYLPGDKSPREWITCKACGVSALVRIRGKGFCSKECAARHRTGSAHHAWKGPDASYQNLHSRVYRARGKADHCVKCSRTDPETQYEWANLTGDYADVQDFASMCTPCHVAFDIHLRARGSANGNAKLTEDAVREARRRHAAGESAYAMAQDYGVTDVALRNAITGRTWRHI